MPKFTFISDTHTMHQSLNDTIGTGNFLCHCGDISWRGRPTEIEDFCEWYNDLPGFEYKILISGNHDFMFETDPEQAKSILAKYPNIIYLENSGITLEGINIYGSPIQPEFGQWAFNRQRGPEIAKYWDAIPDNTDVLLTHGPPGYILDRTLEGINTGCDDLLQALKRVQPKVHAFGHIHEGYGTYEKNGTQFINCSVATRGYAIKNLPINIYL